MTIEEALELIGILVQEVLDAAALAAFYGNALGDAKPAWDTLTEMQRDQLRLFVLGKLKESLEERGWGLDIQMLREIAKS